MATLQSEDLRTHDEHVTSLWGRPGPEAGVAYWAMLLTADPRVLQKTNKSPVDVQI